jgi:two-component system cell cycle response regulator
MTNPLRTTKRFSSPGGLTPLDTPACLVQIYGGALGRRVELLGSPITIGRDDDNEISVDQSTVSRRHSRVFSDGRQHWVEDLKSTNGTFVNDREIAAPTPLRNGDLIRCGSAVFKFIEGGNVEALYHEEIHRLTLTDGLTQIANKRHFREFVERELARALRHQRPLALVMFDADHFKKVNDEHGHLAGDRVLCGIAALVAPEVRREELLARWGGEEFAVVLPETALDDATRFAERIRQMIADAAFEYDGKMLGVTISVGTTALADGDSLQTLVDRADALLARAKHGGRNQVCSG